MYTTRMPDVNAKFDTLLSRRKKELKRKGKLISRTRSDPASISGTAISNLSLGIRQREGSTTVMAMRNGAERI